MDDNFEAVLAAITTGPGSKIEVMITPTPEQYRQLVRDLAILLEAGATSHTEAIIDAIRAAAYAIEQSKNAPAAP